MRNFSYQNPTKLIFGKNTIAELANEIPQNAKVLLTYGGGSIKSNGVYDAAKKALGSRVVFEFGGIEPNPRYETCMKTLSIIKKEGIDFLLAVGGGSVLDGTKFIALAAKYQGEDPWDFMCGKASSPSEALPLASVLTLPATGSESNANFVISRDSTQEKFGGWSPLIYPKFSILDPETTYSLPVKQTANGIVDTFVHTMEQYLTFPEYAPLQDRWAESILVTLIEQGPLIIENPNDYNVRATLMWTATMALNGLISRGVPEDWTTHGIGHELTAFYGIDHGQSLAVVMPALWKNQFEKKKAKLAQYGNRVWGILSNKPGQEGKDDIANLAIEKTEEFFESLGVPTKLSGYGIAAAEAAEKISKRFEARGLTSERGLGENACIGPKEIREILCPKTL
ncbi:MAG: iron-containing alcohol dehydrogenase [Fibromonadaceae bacterium]|jgi:NADP-dependent alcohol dehydrogenase|nr:iron-containing alcohol dehydrogenase [Fibromonadaceae bacterium]